MIEIEWISRKTPRHPWFLPLHSIFGANLAHGFADTVAREEYTKDELIVSLGNSIKLREAEIRRRQGSTVRKLLNRPTVGDDLDQIDIDGKRLQQLLAMTGHESSEPIAALELYRLRLGVLRDLVETVSKPLSSGA